MRYPLLAQGHTSVLIHSQVRQKRGITDSNEAWQRWSSTMDKAMGVVVQLATTAAVDVQELSIKLGAILWTIEVNESLLDAGDLRRLKAFERELRRFATG